MAKIAEAERKKCVEAKKSHLEWGKSKEKSQRRCDKEKMQKKKIEEKALSIWFRRELIVVT